MVRLTCRDSMAMCPGSDIPVFIVDFVAVVEM